MDSVDKYIRRSKTNLITIVQELEHNIEFLNNDLWDSLEEFNNILNGVVNIYYDNYYLYILDNYDKINSYININKKINKKLKTILLSIIDYYEKANKAKIIRDKESSILYLSILIYLGIIIYNINFNKINEPKKIEKTINNIIDNFAKIRFKKTKDLIELISNIKNSVLFNNKFYDNINKLNNNFSQNNFIKINSNNYYRVLYDYKIKDLEMYESKDINIVKSENNINLIMNKISFDLCYYTMFKLLNNGINKLLLFPIKKEYFSDNNFMFYLDRCKRLLNNIKFIIDYKDIEGDYNFINLIKEKNIDLYINVEDSKETNNYNMFMDIKNVVCPEDFLSINEKYLEIWKDMNMNFIIKNIEDKINEDLLIKGR